MALSNKINKARIIGKVGLVDNIHHERITGSVARDLVVLFENFGKGKVGHDRKGLKQQ